MLIGGTPGTGKTTLALCAMSRMARKYGTRSTMLNLEMNKDRLISRMAADLAEVDYSDILSGALTDEENLRVQHALKEIVNLPIDIVCARGKDVGWLISKVREHALQGSKVFFVDHLQLIESSNEDRNTALGDITLALKNASNKFGVRVIILTQLTDKGGGKWVVRDSGAVDSKVDTFMIMEAENDYDTRSIRFKLPKNRDGKPSDTGFTMILNAPWQRFVDPYESRLERQVAAD
jgi:replicative DNA helicase